MSESLKPHTEQGCTFCLYPRRKDLEVAVGSGTITKKVAAEQLKVRVEDIDAHMNYHMPKPQAAMRIVHDKTLASKDSMVFNKRNLLLEKMLMLGERIDAYFQQDTLGPSMTKQLIEQIDQYRKCIMDLARLEGELKQEITITYNHYQSLRALVLGGLCPNCQNKVINLLSQEEKRDVDSTKRGSQPITESATGRTILIQ